MEGVDDGWGGSQVFSVAQRLVMTTDCVHFERNTHRREPCRFYYAVFPIQVEQKMTLSGNTRL